MNQYRLKPRMMAAASFARNGKRFADIGTDHAYLPLYLVGMGISPGGVASDINRGPLERAEINIKEAGFEDRISLNLGNGLDGTENAGAEDIYVLGMGGELIVSILDACSYLKNPELRLILQPMTHHFDVRRYLLTHGFDIIDECLAEEDDRIYQIICASYDGCVRQWTETELIVGKRIIEKRDPLLPPYAERLAAVYWKAAEGLEKSGSDAARQRELEKNLLLLSENCNFSVDILYK